MVMDANWKDKLIVVGIDFGTTYSGFAISLRDDYEKDKTAALTHEWKPEEGPPLVYSFVPVEDIFAESAFGELDIIVTMSYIARSITSIRVYCQIKYM